jgi:hypothetical protein
MQMLALPKTPHETTRHAGTEMRTIPGPEPVIISTRFIGNEPRFYKAR